MMRKSIEDISVSEDEIKSFYHAHSSEFVTPNAIHASHILISDDVTSSDTVMKIMSRLKSGESFDVVVSEVSICPSASNGGDLGTFTEGQMLPEFEKAAFALENPGDISEPTPTMFGWHIIKLIERVPGQPVTLEGARDQILTMLEQRKIANALVTKREELAKIYGVEIIARENVNKHIDAPSGGDPFRAPGIY